MFTNLAFLQVENRIIVLQKETIFIKFCAPILVSLSDSVSNNLRKILFFYKKRRKKEFRSTIKPIFQQKIFSWTKAYPYV